MKKLCILFSVLLCLTLCACPAKTEDVPPTVTQVPTTVADTALPEKAVHITAGKIEPGMTCKDVLVEVTLEQQPIPCRVELTALTAEGFYTMEESEPVSADNMIRLDVYYSLPQGYDVDNIQVTMDCDGGQYDGTGSVGNDDNGCVEAWSHAIYGEEEPEETEPVEETEPIEETQPHDHDWVEDSPGYSYPSCTTDQTKTYTCSCGQTKAETVPALGHNWKEGAMIQPTCTEAGSQTKTCTRCGQGLIDSIPATGHSWSAWVMENGRLHKHTCSVCGEEETANHNIPAGTVTCTDCGADIIN